MRAEDAGRVGAKNQAVFGGRGASLAELLNRAQVEADSAAYLIDLRERRARNCVANLLVERIALGERDDHWVLARIAEGILFYQLFNFRVGQ